MQRGASTMFWIPLSVPLMALGVAVAVVPVVWGSVRHHRAEMVHARSGLTASPGTSAAAPAPNLAPAVVPLAAGEAGAEMQEDLRVA